MYSKTLRPGLTVPGKFWLTWTADKPDTNVMFADHTEIGTNGPPFTEFNAPQAPGEWYLYASEAVTALTVGCRGERLFGVCRLGQPDEPGGLERR